jgi:hypothetical protein
MPAIIDSAPDCVVSDSGTEAARVDDSADFVIGNNFQDCAGFMTFGPGSTYGPEGVGGESAYLVLTWLGIVVMVFILIYWIVYENRKLLAHVMGRRDPTPDVPQPGMTADADD